MKSSFSKKSEYNRMISSIFLILKSIGFTKTKAELIIRKQDAVGKIQFQQARGNSEDLFRFTINLDVSSVVINEFIRKKTTEFISESNSHWSVRLGHLTPEGNDLWWEVSEEAHLNDINLDKISSLLLAYGVPVLLPLLDNNELLNYWYRGELGGLTLYQRLKYMTVLEKVKNGIGFDSILVKFIEYSASKGMINEAQRFVEQLNA